jgi:hypothetical protein
MVDRNLKRRDANVQQHPSPDGGYPHHVKDQKGKAAHERDQARSQQREEQGRSGTVETSCSVAPRGCSLAHPHGDMGAPVAGQRQGRVPHADASGGSLPCPDGDLGRQANGESDALARGDPRQGRNDPRDQRSEPSGLIKPRRANIWDLRKLAKINRRRNHGLDLIANDADGRAMLVAQLHCGRLKLDALRIAPWAGDELFALRKAARKMSFEDIGPSIKLTFDEWKRLKRCRFWPCDVLREEVEAYKRQARSETNKKASARYRADRRAWSDLIDKEVCAIDRIIRRHGSLTLPALTTLAVHSPAFPTGWSGLGSAMRHLKVRLEKSHRTRVRKAAYRAAGYGVVVLTSDPKRRRHHAVIRVSPVCKADANRCKKFAPKSGAITKGRKRRIAKALTPIFAGTPPVSFTCFADDSTRSNHSAKPTPLQAQARQEKRRRKERMLGKAWASLYRNRRAAR